jgi:hypothetical protein
MTLPLMLSALPQQPDCWRPRGRLAGVALFLVAIAISADIFILAEYFLGRGIALGATLSASGKKPQRF